MPGDGPADAGERTVASGDVPGPDGATRRTPDESTVGLASSADSPPPSSDETDLPRLKVGESLAGRFTILRFIARGGMGGVYEANDVMLKTRVALKVIRGRIATDATAMERFRREVLLARRVAHPNVCKVYELYEATTEAGVPIHFLTMELLEGETLGRRLARQGRLSTVEALPLVRQMCEGLEAAHAEGVIHRDFKSGNVMLVPRSGTPGEPTTESTRVVITDFGVARAMELAPEAASEGPLTGRAGILGTPEYMAPEQVTGGEVTPATDIYALGVVLYEMVTGKLPFAGDTPLASAARRLNEAPPRPEVTVPGLDKRWAAAILRCLARQPDRRFNNARDIIPALDRRPQRRPPWLTLSAGALVLILGTFAFTRYGASLRFKEPPRDAVQAAPRPAVAILGFRDEVTSPRLNWLPIAVSEGLAHELAAAETSLRVIPTDRVAEVRRSLGVSEDDVTDEKTWRRMQALLAVNVLAYGNLRLTKPGAEDVSLEVHLLDAQTDKQRGALERDLGPRGEKLSQELVSIGAELRTMLGASLSQDEQAALSASRLQSPDAAEAYAQGVMRLRKFEYTDARGFFAAAQAADSNFLDAQRRIADTWERQKNRKKAQEVIQHMRARPRGLTFRQQAELDAKLQVLGPDLKKANEAQMALLEAKPDDVELALDLAKMDGLALRTIIAIVRKLRLLPAPASTDLRLDIVEAHALGLLGDTLGAHEILSRLCAIASEWGARTELAWCLEADAHVLWDSEARGVDALVPVREAERLLTEVGDLDELARAKEFAGYVLRDVDTPSRALTAMDAAAGLYRRLGNRMDLQRVLLGSIWPLRRMGQFDLARKRADEARSELEFLGEPLTEDYFFVSSVLAFDAADLQAVQELRKNASPDEPEALIMEALALRERDQFQEARDTLARAATLNEQAGHRVLHAIFENRRCALDCDEGNYVSGLKCLANHPVPAAAGEFFKAESLREEATCKYFAKDYRGAQRVAEDAVSNAERFTEFSERILSGAILMRVAASHGDAARAISKLRAYLSEVETKHNGRLAFEVALALGDIEQKAGRAEGRTRLLELEQKAKSREFLRIARLAREALDRNAVTGAR